VKLSLYSLTVGLGAIIGTLGFSYFVIYLLMFLIFHFPSSQQSIPYCPLCKVGVSTGLLEAAFLGRAFGFIDESEAQSLLAWILLLCHLSTDVPDLPFPLISTVNPIRSSSDGGEKRSWEELRSRPGIKHRTTRNLALSSFSPFGMH
jgi:hypothetical protein